MATKKEKQERRATLRPHPARDQITGGTLGSTAYHVRTLVGAGVVELADEGRVRGAVEHFYAIVPGGEDETRLTDPVGQLLGLCGALTVPDADGGYPKPAVLDDPAREQLQALIAQLRPEVQTIVAAATARNAG
jgi:hypothetical protein